MSPHCICFRFNLFASTLMRSLQIHHIVSILPLLFLRFLFNILVLKGLSGVKAIVCFLLTSVAVQLTLPLLTARLLLLFPAPPRLPLSSGLGSGFHSAAKPGQPPQKLEMPLLRPKAQWRPKTLLRPIAVLRPQVLLCTGNKGTGLGTAAC